MNPKNIFYTLLVCLGLIKSGKPDVKREKKDKKKKKKKKKERKHHKQIVWRFYKNKNEIRSFISQNSTVPILI